jgi:hypothetical protein
MAKLASLILVIVIATIMVFPFGFEAKAQDQCQADCAASLKDAVTCCVEYKSSSCYESCGTACEYFNNIGQCVLGAEDVFDACNLNCKGSQF